MKTPKNFEISNEDIGYLIVCALEGGINYWCRNAEKKRNEDGTFFGVSAEDQEKIEYASDLIGHNGTIILHDAESSDKWELTPEKFLKAVDMTLEWGEYESVEEMMDNHDAETADVLVQYAIFDEITFG